MGTNAETQAAQGGKPHFSPVSRANRPASFVIKWRALQQQRASQAARLDGFPKEISKTVAAPRRFVFRPGAVLSFPGSL